jgi:hypothetical protein
MDIIHFCGAVRLWPSQVLCVVDELGKLIEVFEYLSRYASETLSTNFEQPLIN